jgi:hypothetical protein
MRLEGRRLILEEKLEDIIDYININNVDNSYKHEIYFNNKKYVPAKSGDVLIFKVPEKLVENTMFLKVYNGDGQYLYSTNTIIISHIDTKEEKEREYYNFQKMVMNKYSNLENLINSLNDRCEKFNKKIDKLSNDINNDLRFDEIQSKIDGLDFYNKKEVDKICNNIVESFNNLENTTYNFQEAVKNKVIEFKNYDDTDLKLETKEVKSFCNSLKEDFNNLKNIFSQLNYQEQIDSIGMKIKDTMNKVVDCENNNRQNLNSLNTVEKEIDETKKNLINTMQSQNDDLFEKYNVLLKEYQDIKQKDKIILPLNIDKKIPPHIFVIFKDGSAEQYSYSIYKSPIGVSDEYGNIIVRGIAKVKYLNEISKGDYVYGNKDGVAEKYDKGFLVINILDENYCEIMI